MKRRQFIGMATAGVAAMAWPATARAGADDPRRTLAHPHLLDILRDGGVVRELGFRYRKNVPAEDNPHALERAILAAAPATEAGLLRARVNEQVKRDFAHGHTVTLDGWVLSLTEARQCALFSLL